MSNIKLKDEELDRLKTIQDKIQYISLELGQIELSKISLNKKKENTLKFLSEIENDEKSFIEDMEKTYGVGRINVKTGEFILNEE